MVPSDGVDSATRSAVHSFFTRVGLDPDCVTVYCYLLRRNPASVPEVAAAEDLAADRVVAAAQSLAVSRFVRFAAPAQTISLLRPDAGVTHAMATAEEQAAAGFDALREVRSLSSQFAQLSADLEAESSATRFELLDDSESVVNRLHELNHHVQDEILTVVPQKPSTASMAAARRQDAELLERGVRVRGLYLTACRNDPQIAEYLRWMHEQGAAVRLAPTLPTRIQIFDGRTALVALAADGSCPGAILVHNPGLIAALLHLFESVWEAADAPFGAPRHDIELTPHQQEVVRLLARGSKDEAVARRMGVSVRTVRRTIAELSEAAGAVSRFDLGVYCAERGWTGTPRLDPGHRAP